MPRGMSRMRPPARTPFTVITFRILTRQGKAAPGGKQNYMSEGVLTGGFALVAYPEHWDQSGIMTFIVNQDGKVYQRNLGEKTSRIAGAMKEYNPDVNGRWCRMRASRVRCPRNEHAHSLNPNSLLKYST